MPKFIVDPETNEVTVKNVPALENMSGRYYNGMALFYGSGWRNYQFAVANVEKRKYRLLATSWGDLLIKDSEIDLDAIKSKCKYGVHNAEAKKLKYGGISRWDNFENGYNALCWTLYPDGRYFADSDGFGGEDNAEEKVYAIIDKDLKIVVPFQPMDDVRETLARFRKGEELSR